MGSSRNCLAKVGNCSVIIALWRPRKPTIAQELFDAAKELCSFDPRISSFLGHVLSLELCDMAEGLNRSLQVDDKSLENLQGTFKEIKTALADKPGADQIAYRQGDPGARRGGEPRNSASSRRVSYLQ